MQNNRMCEIEDSQADTRERKRGIFTFLVRIANCIATGLLATFLVAGIAYRVLSWFGMAVALALFLPHMTCCVMMPAFTRRKQPPKAYKTFVSSLWILFTFFLAVEIVWPDSETWRTYTFEAELAAIESEREIPDAENAATLYESIWALTDLDAIQRKILNECGPFPATYRWEESGDPKVSAWLDDCAETVDDLMKACQVEKCRFPVQAEPFADIGPELSERHDRFRLSSHLLFLAAERDFGNGRTEAGFEKCQCVFRMAKHHSQQSTLMSFLDSLCIEQRALDLACRLIMESSATDKGLQLIAKSVDIEDNWSEDLSRILEVEKLRAKNLCGAFYEVNVRGRTRFSRRFHTGFARRSPGSGPTVNWERRIADMIAPIGLALLVPCSPETAGKVIDDTYEKYHAATGHDFDWHNLEECEQHTLTQMRRLRGMRFFLRPFAHIIDIRELSRFHDLYVLQLARRRACHIVIGLRRYKNKCGRWPATLEDIKSLTPARAFIHPIDGCSFGYKLVGDGFRLYNKDRINLNEGRHHYNRKERQIEAEGWPI